MAPDSIQKPQNPQKYHLPFLYIGATILKKLLHGSCTSQGLLNEVGEA